MKIPTLCFQPGRCCQSLYIHRNSSNMKLKCLPPTHILSTCCLTTRLPSDFDLLCTQWTNFLMPPFNVEGVEKNDCLRLQAWYHISDDSCEYSWRTESLYFLSLVISAVRCQSITYKVRNWWVFLVLMHAYHESAASCPAGLYSDWKLTWSYTAQTWRRISSMMDSSLEGWCHIYQRHLASIPSVSEGHRRCQAWYRTKN